MATILQIAYMIGFVVLSTLFFVALDVWFHLGLTSDMGTNVFIMPFIVVWAVILFTPSVRRNFFNSFVRERKIFQSIFISIFVAILLGFLVNILRFIPYWLGYQVIGVGSNQVTTIKDVSNLGLLIGISIIGPFTEEILFRYVMIAGARSLFSDFPDEREWLRRIVQHFQRNGRVYWFSWIIVVNIIFAIMHGPNSLNFALYFLPGLVYSWFFLRYGFLAAWISHGMYNFFSGIALQIVIYIFFNK